MSRVAQNLPKAALNQEFKQRLVLISIEAGKNFEID
jgi:hypothetical protein